MYLVFGLIIDKMTYRKFMLSIIAVDNTVFKRTNNISSDLKIVMITTFSVTLRNFLFKFQVPFSSWGKTLVCNNTPSKYLLLFSFITSFKTEYLLLLFFLLPLEFLFQQVSWHFVTITLQQICITKHDKAQYYMYV